MTRVAGLFSPGFTEFIVSACLVLAILANAPDSRAKPATPRNDRFGVFDISADRRAITAVHELGVGWIRVQHRMGEARAQRRLNTLTRGIDRLVQMRVGLWLTIYHRDPGNVREAGTVGYAATRRGGFPPANIKRYQANVARVVSRLADAFRAHGVRPSDWLVVQFGNEVVPRDVAPPDRPMRFWHGTANQYLSMLAAGYAAVKRVEPGLQVASAGIPSMAMEMIRTGERRIAKWYDRQLREVRADWADVHLRHAISDVHGKIAWVRRRWRGPLAATEIAGPDPRTGAAYSDARQADDLRRRITTAVEAGVDRVFWASLVENPHVRAIHRKEGLIARDPWRRKPGFGVYRRLIDRSPNG